MTKYNMRSFLCHQLKGLIYCNEMAVDWARRDRSVVKSACYTIGRNKVWVSVAT